MKITIHFVSVLAYIFKYALSFIKVSHSAP